ncbi:G-protein coupled receptor moody [Amphibalanus amphitrite]|uniref:G-protein coupled receptor moody n=2 Tax=Amphibalanus amphitrite TaxID=1232801 RepID=A0A6A4VZK6_AMPAM|nr:G-protein coupled receptor moody-like isoform X1 [Amphibalanus amphitrite]KAF0297024.1 G-protein coupled receptor moody [Amphibalanus amphitrite]
MSDNSTMDPTAGDEDLGELSKFSQPLMTLTAFLIAVYMIVGLFGNAITVLALLRCPRVRNVTTAFIVSLCIADFSFCLLVLPFEVSRFSNGAWLFGEEFLCVLFPLLKYGNVGCSLLSIAMITINRFVMVAFNKAYQKIYQWRWVWAQLAFIWLYSYLMLVPTLAGSWGRFGFDPRLKTCTIIRVDGHSAKIPLFIIGFVIPSLAICICYAGILAVVIMSHRRQRRHSARETSQQKKSREERSRKSEMRITKMSLAVFVTFVVCYLPITIAKVKDPTVKYPGVHILGYILVYLSACVNPIIYVIMSKQYRQAYKTVLFCQRPRLFSENSSQCREDRQRPPTPSSSKTMMSQLSVTEREWRHSPGPRLKSASSASDNAFLEQDESRM